MTSLLSKIFYVSNVFWPLGGINSSLNVLNRENSADDQPISSIFFTVQGNCGVSLQVEHIFDSLFIKHHSSFDSNQITKQYFIPLGN